MRCGRPNSRIAASALKNGHSPPNVKAVATKRGGVWRRAKLASIVADTCELSISDWSGEREGGSTFMVSDDLWRAKRMC